MGPSTGIHGSTQAWKQRKTGRRVNGRGRGGRRNRRERRTDILKIVVLSTGANALLAVCRALQRSLFARRIHLTKEDGLELVHAGVGELQRGVIVGNDGRRDHKRVSMLLNEEIDEGLAHFIAGPIRRHCDEFGTGAIKTEGVTRVPQRAPPAGEAK